MNDGTVLKLSRGDPRFAEVSKEPAVFIQIGVVPSRVQYQWLDTFIKSVADDGLRGRLEAATNGKGAFRRFKDILASLPEERRQWFELRDTMLRDYLVEWIEQLGIESKNPPPWSEEGKKLIPAGEAEIVASIRDFLLDRLASDQEAMTPGNLEALAQALFARYEIRPRV